MADVKPAAKKNLSEQHEKLKNNKLAAMFEQILFEPADSRVYPDERTGRRSKKVASVGLVLCGGDYAIPGSIYLTQEKNGPKQAEFSLVGQRQVQAIKPLEEAGRIELNAIKLFIAEEYKAWRKKNPTTTTATKATAVTMDDVDDF